MLNANSLNQTFSSQVADKSARNRSIDLELFNEGSTRDAENLGDLCHQLLVALLVKEDFVVELVLDLDFGPALLLSFSAAFLRTRKGTLLQCLGILRGILT